MTLLEQLNAKNREFDQRWLAYLKELPEATTWEEAKAENARMDAYRLQLREELGLNTPTMLKVDRMMQPIARRYWREQRQAEEGGAR